MTTSNEMEGLVGEHEPEVPLGAMGGGGTRADAGAMPPGDRVFEPEVVVRRLSGNRYLIHGRYEVEVTVHPHRPARGLPLWVASAVLETPRGPMQWAASATEHEVARRLATVGGFDFGQFLGQLFDVDQGHHRHPSPSARGRPRRARHRVRRNAAELAVARVLHQVRRTLDSPGSRGVISALSAIPYVGTAVQGIRAATTLADNVMQGNRRARQNLVRLHRAARRGDPHARRAVGMVNAVLRGQRRIAMARAYGSPASRRRRPHSPAEHAAWRRAETRWNEYRASQAREGDPAPEPLIPPAPRARS